MISNLGGLKRKERISCRIDFNYYEVYDKAKNDTYSARISTRTISEYYKNEYLSLKNEIQIIPFLHHPSISEYIMFSMKDFTNESYPTIITEYAKQGPLNNIIHQKSPKLTTTNKLIIIYGVASGMSYLHSHDILHCDLKTANV